MRFLIEYNDNVLDVTDDVLSKTFEYQDRVDEAFAIGSVQIKTSKIHHNIPPYSIMKSVDDSNNNDFYLCSSEVNKYLTNDKYVHNVTLLEPTAILECYIVGSKAFSVTGTNTYDYEKIMILCSLIKQKYGVTISYTSISEIFTEKHEFTFGPGATLFSVLTEIATKYNYRPKVSSLSKNRIHISFINLSQNEIYVIDNDKILNYTSVQSVDSYCKYLEAEMTNVIDRNSIIDIPNISARSEEVLLSDDTAVILLPTRVEKVLDFKVKKRGSIKGSFRYNLDVIPSVLAKIDALDITWKVTAEYLYIVKHLTMTLKEWVELDILPLEVNVNGVTVVYNMPEYIWNNYYSKYFDEEFYNNQVFTLRYEYDVNNGVDIVKGLGFYVNDNEHWSFAYEDIVKFPLIDWILEKEQWNLLPAAEQPKYAVYETGGNKIYNLNSEYKKDIWNQLLGNDVGNIFEEIKNISINETFYNCSFWLTISVSEAASKPSEYLYSVKYIAITNPTIVHEKKDEPVNEKVYKEISRSYDKTGNGIDYDLLVDSFEKTNSMLGKPEVTIEYDIGDIVEPYAGQKVIYNNVEYYIMSVVYKCTFARDYAELNLARTYYKVADSIGVKTQFNSVKNPLNNIIERPIFIKMSIPAAQFLVLPNVLNNLYFRFAFSTGVVLYKKCIFMNHDNTYHAYCETIDQYAFDKKVIGTSGKRECRDVSYCNEYNECYSMSVAIVYISHLTYEETLLIPEYSGSFKVFYKLDDVLLYKDAREKLTFTVLFEKNVVNNDGWEIPGYDNDKESDYDGTGSEEGTTTPEQPEGTDTPTNKMFYYSMGGLMFYKTPSSWLASYGEVYDLGEFTYQLDLQTLIQEADLSSYSEAVFGCVESTFSGQIPFGPNINLEMKGVAILKLTKSNYEEISIYFDPSAIETYQHSVEENIISMKFFVDLNYLEGAYVKNLT